VNSQGRTKWWPPRWASLSNLTERLPTWQVGSSSHSPTVFSVLPRNRFDRLRTAETTREATRVPQGVSLHPLQLVHGRHQSQITESVTREVQPRQVRMQPRGSSYFLPGKIAGKPANFLFDSGCTTNLLSCQFFDTLSAKVRSGLEPYKGDDCTLADGRAFLSILLLNSLDASATGPSRRRSSSNSSMRMLF